MRSTCVFRLIFWHTFTQKWQLFLIKQCPVWNDCSTKGIWNKDIWFVHYCIPELYFLYRGLKLAIFVSGDLEYAIFMYGRRLENAVFCMWGYWKVHFWYVVVSKMPLFGMWGLKNVFLGMSFFLNVIFGRGWKSKRDFMGIKFLFKL